MKIVVTISSMRSGGAERVISNLANKWATRGHSINIVMIGTNDETSFYDLTSKVDLVSLHAKHERVSHGVERVLKLRKLIKNIKPDVVISFLPEVIIYTYLALLNTKIPFFCSERSDPSHYKKHIQFIMKLIFSNSSGCVFQTNMAENWYKLSKRKNTKIIYNPVYIDTSVIKDTMPIPNKNFIFVGSYQRAKNFPLLLSTFKKFIQFTPGYKLLIYGVESTNEQLLKEIENYNLLNDVKICGKQQNWHFDAINSAVFISTSLYEGMSNSVLEAAVLGIPCVVTDCPIGGNREIASIYKNVILSKLNQDDLLYSISCALKIQNRTTYIHRKIDIDFVSEEWLSFIDQII